MINNKIKMIKKANQYIYYLPRNFVQGLNRNVKIRELWEESCCSTNHK